MRARTPLLALFTLVCAAACIGLPFIPQTADPFDATAAPGNTPALSVLPSSLGLSMPEGLKGGDRVELADLSPRVRTYFMTGLNPPAGTVIDLVVRRPDGIHHVPSTFQVVGFLNGSTANRLTEAAAYILMLGVTALGLLLLWRSRSPAALGVALWCFSLPMQNILQTIPLPFPYGLLLSVVSGIAANALTLIGLYIVAVSLAGTALPPVSRRRLDLVFTAVVIAYCSGIVSFHLWFYYFGTPMSLQWTILVRVLHVGGFAIPLVLLITAYRRATPVNQARIRWVLFSLLGLVASYILNLLPQSFDIPQLLVNIAATLFTAAAFVGFAYAVLRHQLVSLQFVLNRALVYGLITSLVVGVFAAMLSFLEHATLNTETNRTLALLVPLILGMGLNTLKRNVDEYINKLFFRQRRRAEESLEQFSRTCAYVEDAEVLLDLTADEMFRHGGPQSLAIYLTEPGKAGAKLVRQRGTGDTPAHLNVNDLGLLRLRAGDLEVDLHGVASGLGAEGSVYAFTVRGQVLGFIVLGPRPAEAYTQEERRLFALVAHQVAVALHALRLEEQYRLLQELAEGGFTSLPTAQAKAKELVGVRAAG